MMDRDRLRTVQEPLKKRYREDPEAALVTLRATGTLGEGITCSVATGRALAEAGLHPATGGDGVSLCSGDMLLEALVACAGVTLRAVATSLDLDVETGTVRAEGDLDFRGTLAVSKEAPVGFSAIRLNFDLRDERERRRPRHPAPTDGALLRRVPDDRTKSHPQRLLASNGRVAASTCGAARVVVDDEDGAQDRICASVWVDPRLSH